MLSYYAPTLFFLVCSIWLLFFPPKYINPWMGVRTYLTMRNEEDWSFAQKYAPKIALLGGLMVLILQIFVHFFVIHSVFQKEYILIVLCVNVMVWIFVVRQTEKKIKKNHE